ncbi:MAG: hypothetical protein ICV74_08685 [Thermoleophilia bacterium]|nr:hypothetical protein [Thermoleophilia bacterium]
MTTLEVYPRDTPAERAEELVPVDVDEDLGVLAATLEDWVSPRQNWELTLREGTEFGKANNVEARVLYVGGEQTSSLLFRLEQLEIADDTGSELVLRFEETDGIAKLAYLRENGLDVELFHILTYT